jgi:hypothetical protein
MNKKHDSTHLSILLSPLDECAHHKPAFGGNGQNGIDINQFRKIYGDDPLYHWIGLDSDLIYAAHKAAGGITSIYRQLGIGCERLLRKIIQNEYQLDDTQVAWPYSYDKGNGTMATHTLDACIRTNDIKNLAKREKFCGWLFDAAHSMGYSNSNVDSLSGAAFEIRQGYKSADSKRQNADLRFGMRARSDDALLPPLAFAAPNPKPAQKAARWPLWRWRGRSRPARCNIRHNVRQINRMALFFCFFSRKGWTKPFFVPASNWSQRRTPISKCMSKYAADSPMCKERPGSKALAAQCGKLRLQPETVGSP